MIQKKRWASPTNPEAGRAVGMRRDQAQLEPRHPPEEAIPDEKSPEPAPDEELEQHRRRRPGATSRRACACDLRPIRAIATSRSRTGRRRAEREWRSGPPAREGRPPPAPNPASSPPGPVPLRSLDDRTRRRAPNDRSGPRRRDAMLDQPLGQDQHGNGHEKPGVGREVGQEGNLHRVSDGESLHGGENEEERPRSARSRAAPARRAGATPGPRGPGVPAASALALRPQGRNRRSTTNERSFRPGA